MVGDEAPPTLEAQLHAPPPDFVNSAQYGGLTMFTIVGMCVQVPIVYVGTIRRGPRMKQTLKWESIPLVNQSSSKKRGRTTTDVHMAKPDNLTIPLLLLDGIILTSGSAEEDTKTSSNHVQ